MSVTFTECAIYVMRWRIHQTYLKLVKPTEKNYRYADAIQQCQHLHEVYHLYYLQYLG
jgi:hypothetical protein